MFQFHYTLTEDDYIKFNLNHSLNTKIGKRSSLISMLAILVLSALILSMLSLISNDFSLLITEFITLTLVCIFWFTFSKKITLRNIKKNVRMMKKSGRLPYNEYGTLTFEENFICDAAPTQELKTAYNLIEAIYTTDEAIYIYISAASALILPYRFIENQAVFNNLMNFLQAKTNKTVINITK